VASPVRVDGSSGSSNGSPRLLELVLTPTAPPPVVYGFALGGGAEQRQPLTVERLQPGGLAAHSGLCLGDELRAVASVSVVGQPRAAVLAAIAAATPPLHLTVARASTSVAATPARAPPPHSSHADGGVFTPAHPPTPLPPRAA
jgi:F-box protein 20